MLYSDVALCSTDTTDLQETESLCQKTNNAEKLRENLKKEQQRTLKVRFKS